MTQHDGHETSRRRRMAVAVAVWLVQAVGREVVAHLLALLALGTG